MTDMFELADRFVDDACALQPVLATVIGVPGYDDQWGVGGIQGVELWHRLNQEYRPRLAGHTDATDPRDRLGALVMSTAIDEEDESYRSGDHFRQLRHLGSPFQRLRTVFDVMRTDTTEAWDHIASRLETISVPLTDYRELLRAGIEVGQTVAMRQVESVIRQARLLAGESSSFEAIAAKAAAAGQLSDRLLAAITRAQSSVAEFADWLEAIYLPAAAERDAAGRDVYERSADRLLGMAVDADEAYEWGWDELGRLTAELERVAEGILPGEGIGGAVDHLESDPTLTADGTDALVVFVEQILAAAVDDLAGSHFDVPDPIRPLTVQIAAPGGPLGVYYMRPSEDLTRPGGVWYSIGDQRVFPLYQHVSTAYHEGFPGHHLQIATATYQRESLSRFQRVMTWYPGYGEGWGMYAEVLMGELGYLENPHHYFGMLAKQMYRAARVVVDIGLHLEKRIPSASPMLAGEEWSFERAIEFMQTYGFRTPDQARDEVLRYLGWPGQAIAYKLGEREILRIRSEARSRLGDRFDLKGFHSVVLNHGAMRLDLLDRVVTETLV